MSGAMDSRYVTELLLRVYPPDSDNVADGLRAVLSGSYDLPGLHFDRPPVIIDGGAHVGSFSVFAAHRFPGAMIYAFEPHPQSAKLLRQNTEGLGVTVEECALVGDDAPHTVVLYEGLNNSGQRSIFQLGEQRTHGVRVQTRHAVTLPRADVLKLDTEGCELPVLRAYPHMPGVRAVMLEWHRIEDYHDLLRLLPSWGFDLAYDSAKGAWIADRNLIFVRRSNASTAVDYEASRAAERAKPQDVSLAGVAREYDLASLPDLDCPIVLDIGANRGNFSRLVLQRWPGAFVHAFEPNPKTYAALRSATDLARIGATCAAVKQVAKGRVRLFLGVNGDHECSTRDDVRWPHCSQRLDQWIDVDTFSASSLLRADVVKVDTEGDELEILGGYRHLKSARVLLAEAHAVGGDLRGQAAEIRRVAEHYGLRWIGPDPVIQRFVRLT
jgi:FkbM family methyltransferase